MNYYFLLDGNKIVIRDGHGEYSEIATVINNRACRQLLRHAQLAEDIEFLMDEFIPESSGHQSQPVPCPEVLPPNEKKQLGILGERDEKS